jgi:hypothetical protein
MSEDKGELVELELDEKTIQMLNDLAKERNETIDDTVNFILRQYIDKIHTVTIGDFEKVLQQIDDTDDSSPLNDFYIIVDDFKNPIAKVLPIWTANETI